MQLEKSFDLFVSYLAEIILTFFSAVWLTAIDFLHSASVRSKNVLSLRERHIFGEFHNDFYSGDYVVSQFHSSDKVIYPEFLL